MAEESGEVVKWFTRARRFPQLIGRTPGPNSKRIPGGPYTMTQFVGGAATLWIASKTTWAWAHFGMVKNLGFACLVAAGVVFLLGKLPDSARNPLVVGIGLVRSVSSPRTGRVQGQRIRIPAPHRVHHKVLIATPAAAPAGPPTASPPSPPTDTTPARAPALTGVQSLLAQQPASRKERV